MKQLMKEYLLRYAVYFEEDEGTVNYSSQRVSIFENRLGNQSNTVGKGI
jgi:hypothetical protein